MSKQPTCTSLTRKTSRDRVFLKQQPQAQVAEAPKAAGKAPVASSFHLPFELPSGKHTKNYGKIHRLEYVNQL